MIRAKQLEELQRLNKSLRESGKINAPSLEKHVMLALVSGEVPKLKPVKAISDTAKRKIVSERYSRNLSFGDVFASCNGYEVEQKQFEAHERTRRAALARFDQDAEKIMIRAMNPESEAADIVEELHCAAERAGLKSIKAPVFGDLTD